jgi:hypothetical protein
MKRRLAPLATALSAAVLAVGSASPSDGQAVAAPWVQAKVCGDGYVHAVLSWGHKCLRVGQFCKINGDREYHRYGFHCHSARLSRSASGGSVAGSGCQPGYSPCLPRVADLNCGDIPASKKPVRVTGEDPYRLDGDGDGWGCD